MANSVDPDQTPLIGAVCSGSTLFASILNSSVKFGNFLQQTTSADDFFRCIFFCALRVKPFSLCSYILGKKIVFQVKQNFKIGTVGRKKHLYFVKIYFFYMGKQYGRTRKSLGNPLKMLKKFRVGSGNKYARLCNFKLLT